MNQEFSYINENGVNKTGRVTKLSFSTKGLSQEELKILDLLIKTAPIFNEIDAHQFFNNYKELATGLHR